MQVATADSTRKAAALVAYAYCLDDLDALGQRHEQAYRPILHLQLSKSIACIEVGQAIFGSTTKPITGAK